MALMCCFLGKCYYVILLFRETLKAFIEARVNLCVGKLFITFYHATIPRQVFYSLIGGEEQGPFMAGKSQVVASMIISLPAMKLTGLRQVRWPVG